MKTTILNLLLVLGFTSTFPLAYNAMMTNANIKTMIPSHIVHISDTLSIGEKIDSIDLLNEELNEKTYKTLQCDNQILSAQKKNILQSRISNRNIPVNTSVEDSCLTLCDTLKSDIN